MEIPERDASYEPTWAEVVAARRDRAYDELPTALRAIADQADYWADIFFSSEPEPFPRPQQRRP